MFNHIFFGKVMSIILTLSVLSLYLLPLAGCSGSGSAGSAGFTDSAATTSAGTTGTETSALSTSSVKTAGGFTMGVFSAKSGGSGNASLSVDVDSGTGLLNICPSDGSTAGLKNTTVTIYGPDNSVMAAIKDGVADNSRLTVMPEPSSALEAGLEKAAGTSALSSSDLEAALVSALTGDKDAQLSSELKSEFDSYIEAMRNTRNGGTAGAAARDSASAQVQTSQSGITIFNPTPGQWKIEVSSTAQASEFDLVAMAVPSSGLPSGDEIGQIVTTLKNTAGWQPKAFNQASDSGVKEDSTSYWLYDAIFWLVKSICKPSVASTVIAYAIVIVYPKAWSKLATIKSTIRSIMDSVANAVGITNVESFTDKVAGLVARAICSIFRQPSRTSAELGTPYIGLGFPQRFQELTGLRSGSLAAAGA